MCLSTHLVFGCFKHLSSIIWALEMVIEFVWKRKFLWTGTIPPMLPTQKFLVRSQFLCIFNGRSCFVWSKPCSYVIKTNKALVLLVWKGALKDTWCQILLLLLLQSCNLLWDVSMDSMQRGRMEALMNCSFWKLLCPSPNVDFAIFVEQEYRPLFRYLCVNVRLDRE